MVSVEVSSAAKAPRSGERSPTHGTRFLRRMYRSRGTRLIGQRLLLLIPVLLGVTFISSAILNVLPGDTASELLGTNATPESLHELTIKLHLNQPFIVRYWHWLVGLFHGDLGRSLANDQTVSSILSRDLPVTFELLAYAFVVAIVVSVPVALVAARRPGGLVDRAITFVAMGGLSIAPFVLGILLILIFADLWSLFPAVGWVPISRGFGSNLHSLTLPGCALGLPIACFYIRLLRSDIVEQMQREEYIVAARAKGLKGSAILVRHALRNSLLGLITVIGLNVGALLGGTVLIESIFSLPGIGNQMLSAIQQRDVPVVEGVLLVFAIIVVLANLATDLLLGVLDPRIRHGRSFV